ncbi:hypothetical protein JKP88DRAFT_334256 [Tribonema minus]|uniref:Calpain catalytic domain-containing protein n=1 Tax=Tribonema minus TaxID=303371 RepID=A0A836C9N9_9STRA|nr:hypothetical protein JKP88DRAFT_334256 [Tribonema minus]
MIGFGLPAGTIWSAGTSWTLSHGAHVEICSLLDSLERIRPTCFKLWLQQYAADMPDSADGLSPSSRFSKFGNSDAELSQSLGLQQASGRKAEVPKSRVCTSTIPDSACRPTAQSPLPPAEPIDIEMDTLDSPDKLDLPSLLLPEGTLPLGHQRVAVCYNEALLRGWVAQPSPCCAAASVAGAFNALRGAARGTPRALTHFAVLSVLEETLCERIDNLRARFERLLGSSVAPLLDALRERVAADGRALGGAGARAVPRKYLLRQVRELVAERIAGDACEGGEAGSDQQPDAFRRLAELLEEEEAKAGGGASGDEALGGDSDGGGARVLLPPPRARAQCEGRRSSQQDDADASGEEADAAEQGACETQTATATAITTADSSSSGLLPLPPETAREARQQQRRRSLSSRSPWRWKTDLYELLKAMGGLEKLTSKRPSTAAFGNAGVIRAVNRLSANGISDAVHYGPTHGSSSGGGGGAARVSARLFMGRAHRSGGGIDVPLSRGDDEAAVAAQWAALREAFCKEGQVVLFHLKNHYALRLYPAGCIDEHAVLVKNMSQGNSAQLHDKQEALRLFLSVTGCQHPAVATKFLLGAEYDLNIAVNHYLSSSTTLPDVAIQVLEDSDEDDLQAKHPPPQPSVTTPRKKPRVQEGGVSSTNSSPSHQQQQLPLLDAAAPVADHLQQIVSHWQRTGQPFEDVSFPPVAARLSTVRKAGANQNRHFYACALRKCNFFQWCASAAPTRQALQLVWRAFAPPRFCLYKSGGAEVMLSMHACTTLSAMWLCACVTRHVRSINAMRAIARPGRAMMRYSTACLAVISERADLIQCVLPASEPATSAGCYHVRLFLAGKWTSVLVDRWLPCKPPSEPIVAVSPVKPPPKPPRKIGSPLKRKASPSKVKLQYVAERTPAFASAVGGQLWPALVEKAYAKAHGSYHAISGGHVREAFTALTGAPTETLLLDGPNFNSEDAWLRLLSFAHARFPMGCATPWDPDTSRAQRKAGLVNNHAYSILEVRELHGIKEGKQLTVDHFFGARAESSSAQHMLQHASTQPPPPPLRLLRIRNPWGRLEWNADWSAKSEQWTRKLRKELDRGEPNDGTFWMRLPRVHLLAHVEARSTLLEPSVSRAYECVPRVSAATALRCSYHDFLQRFALVDVCKAHEGWTHTTFDTATAAAAPPLACAHAFEIVTPPSHSTCTYTVTPLSISNAGASAQPFVFGLYGARALPARALPWRAASAAAHAALHQALALYWTGAAPCGTTADAFNDEEDEYVDAGGGSGGGGGGAHSEAYALGDSAALVVTETPRGVVLFTAVNAHATRALALSVGLTAARRCAAAGGALRAERAALRPRAQALLLAIAAAAPDAHTRRDCAFEFQYAARPAARDASVSECPAHGPLFAEHELVAGAEALMSRAAVRGCGGGSGGSGGGERGYAVVGQQRDEEEAQVLRQYFALLEQVDIGDLRDAHALQNGFLGCQEVLELRSYGHFERRLRGGLS